jgi:hypothetical protein
MSQILAFLNPFRLLIFSTIFSIFFDSQGFFMKKALLSSLSLACLSLTNLELEGFLIAILEMASL